MAITIHIPITESQVNTSFTAHGTYDYADVDITKPAKCTMFPAMGAPTFANLQHCTDGTWRAVFSNLAQGTYRCEAFYTKTNNMQVPAGAQTDVVVAANAPVVMIPACLTPPPPPSPVLPGEPGAAVALAASALPEPVGNAVTTTTAAITSPCGCHGNVFHFNGTFDKCLKFQKAIAIIHERDRPRRYHSVLPVLTHAGHWSVIVPVPSDYPTVAYVMQVVWLSRDGLKVAQTSRGF
jgi:hypothetical protein